MANNVSMIPHKKIKTLHLPAILTIYQSFFPLQSVLKNNNTIKFVYLKQNKGHSNYIP